MPINGFNTGRDVAIDINTPQGPVRFSITTSFRSKQMTKREESKGMDGVNRFQYIPGGWEGELGLDRANANADNIIAQIEAGYYAGQDILPSTITETINEGNGAVSVWRYTGVQLAMEDHGTAEGDKKISQKIAFCASFRRKVQ